MHFYKFGKDNAKKVENPNRTSKTAAAATLSTSEMIIDSYKTKPGHVSMISSDLSLIHIYEVAAAPESIS